MARTIVYRVKTPAGEWQRAVIDENALPQNITGLVAGETYQVDTGKGTLVDVTPLNTFTLETFTGTPVVTGPGEYELTVTAPAYLAAYNPGGGAGIYTWDTTELAAGPKVLYPGSINAASYNVGNTISLVNPAFGVGSGTVDVFYRVYDDGVEIYDGATLSFDTTGIVAASSVSVRAYMVDQNGESAEATILTFTIGAASVPIARLAAPQVILYTGSAINTVSSSSLSATAGTNRLALLMVAFDNRATPGTISATWGSSNFTAASTAQLASNNFRASSVIFWMKEADIPSTSQVVTITASGGNALSGLFAYLAQYENVNQTTPIGATGGTLNNDGSNGNNWTAVVNMTSSTSLMASLAYSRNSSAAFTRTSSGANRVNLFDATNGGAGISIHASEELSAATGNLTHTYSRGTSSVSCTSGVELLRA
jgi:hypothetical protein